MDSSSVLPIAIFLLLMGLMFLAGAGFLFFQSRPFQQNIECMGTVIGLKSDPDEPGSHLYAPIVCFTTHNGQEVIFTGKIYSRPAAYKTGQTVTIVYPHDHPERARIKNESRMLLIIHAAVGIGLTGLGLLFGLGAVLASW